MPTLNMRDLMQSAAAEAFDMAVPVTAGNAQPVGQLGNVSGSVVLDTFDRSMFTATLTGNTTFNVVVAPVAGKDFGRVLVLVDNPDGHSISWGGNTLWIGAPTFEPVALYEVRTFDAGGTWYAREEAGLSAFNPYNLTGLHLWLKADSLALNDGDPVTQWDDLSGTGHAVTCDDPVNQPTFQTGEVNGHPAVVFDSDYLQSAAFTAPTGPQNVAAVVRPSVISAATRRIIHGPGQMTLMGSSQSPPNTFRLLIGAADTPAAGTAVADTVYLLTGVINDASSLIRANGIEGTGTAAPPSVNNYVVGRTGTLDTNAWAGAICEIIVSTGTAWDAQTIADVETYLSDKWGVTLP